MNASLGALANAISHVADEHAKIGLSGGRLDRIGDSLAVRGITLKDERSVVEDTDLSVAIAQLNAQELTLSAAQAAFAKINRQTFRTAERRVGKECVRKCRARRSPNH